MLGKGIKFQLGEQVLWSITQNGGVVKNNVLYISKLLKE